MQTASLVLELAALALSSYTLGYIHGTNVWRDLVIGWRDMAFRWKARADGVGK